MHDRCIQPLTDEQRKRQLELWLDSAINIINASHETVDYSKLIQHLALSVSYANELVDMEALNAN